MRDADVIVVGAGLAGLVATAELADAGRRVIVLDQEPEASLGGQAFWSLGGLFLVDSPEQRRLRIRDSPELALQDWLGSAGFDRPEDAWPRRWAEAYVEFAAGEKRQWLYDQGMRFVPTPAWAERGGYLATEYRRRAAVRPLRRRRGGGVRRRRNARLSVARGYVPRRLPVQRADRRAGGGAGGGLGSMPSTLGLRPARLRLVRSPSRDGRGCRACG
jgi:choline dehydrogenase-like flavoprotein